MLVDSHTTFDCRDAWRAAFHASHVASDLWSDLLALYYLFPSIIGGQPAEPPPTFQSEDELLAWLQTGQLNLCALAVTMLVSVEAEHPEA